VLDRINDIDISIVLSIDVGAFSIWHEGNIAWAMADRKGDDNLSSGWVEPGDAGGA
jgi:hypothetical protein